MSKYRVLGSLPVAITRGIEIIADLSVCFAAITGGPDCIGNDHH